MYISGSRSSKGHPLVYLMTPCFWSLMIFIVLVSSYLFMNPRKFKI